MTASMSILSSILVYTTTFCAFLTKKILFSLKIKDYDDVLDLELDSMDKFVLQCLAFYQVHNLFPFNCFFHGACSLCQYHEFPGLKI